MLEEGVEVPPDNSVITLKPHNDKNSLKLLGDKLIFVIGAFRVVESVETLIGNPVPVPPEAYDYSPVSSESSAPGTKVESSGKGLHDGLLKKNEDFETHFVKDS